MAPSQRTISKGKRYSTTAITHKQLDMVCGALMRMIVVLVVLASAMVAKCAFLVAGVVVSYNLVLYQSFVRSLTSR